ncbi:MAG: hypothetical protein KGJ06_10370, partial [Pseudomonadota bacterium]|nr:hypothetical protein [Pseudomonadota bacterium]
ENPADLKKAVSRAILYEGALGEKPVELFSKIAGPLDLKTGIEKSLKYIKDKKPELAADVDAILKDPLFEDHSNWRATKNADGTPKKEMIRIRKQEDSNYVEGQFRVDMAIPADKLQEVLNQLAALDKPVAPANPSDAAIAAQILAGGTPAQTWVETVGQRPPLAPPQPQLEQSWIDKAIHTVTGALGF